MLPVLVQMGTVVPKAMNQPGGAKVTVVGCVCYQHLIEILTITGLIQTFFTRMPWLCCCCWESSLSFGGALERGGESLSPELALQPTQMPHVPHLPKEQSCWILSSGWNEGHET